MSPKYSSTLPPSTPHTPVSFRFPVTWTSLGGPARQSVQWEMVVPKMAAPKTVTPKMIGPTAPQPAAPFVPRLDTLPDSWFERLCSKLSGNR
jgi:hypothetical protein